MMRHKSQTVLNDINAPVTILKGKEFKKKKHSSQITDELSLAEIQTITLMVTFQILKDVFILSMRQVMG